PERRPSPVCSPRISPPAGHRPAARDGDGGRVGTVHLVRSTWLSDEFDPAMPFGWRFDRSIGGSTIADLGSHLVDLAEWVAGPIAEVSVTSLTFTAERASPTALSAPPDIDVRGSHIQGGPGKRFIYSIAFVHDMERARRSEAPSRRTVNMSSSPSLSDPAALGCSRSSWVARPYATLRPRTGSESLNAAASWRSIRRASSGAR
ncbi:MAG: Gfo/Idh/MocA family protein, partial [Acidimicrobiales bacterium]